MIEADSGPGGLQRAGAEQPQLIFLDLVMPGMSGFEVLEQLKKDPVTRDIPVVIFTSKSLEEDERRRLGAGAAAILNKATPRAEIVGQISQALAALLPGAGTPPEKEAMP